MVLFALGLCCFATTIKLKTANGYRFNAALTQKVDFVHDKDITNSAIIVVGEGGDIFFTGLFVPEPGQTIGSGGTVTNLSTEPVPWIKEREKRTRTVDTTKVPTDFIQRKIPTQQWRGEKIQPVSIEIFGTHQCPYCRYAKDLAFETFGEQNVQVYHIDDDLRYRQKSQDILNAAGSSLKTVPRISVIDANNTRWFIGGYDDFEKFVTNNINKSVGVGITSATEPVIKTDFTKLDLPNPELYTLGMSVQPIQIEIFGADYCPACVQSKALATKIFGADKVQFYDIKKSYQYRSRSDSFLRIVRWPDTRMPRICVIYDRGNGPERLFLGGYGQLQNFISSIGKTNTMIRPQTQNNWPKNNSQRVQNNWSQNQKTQSGRPSALAPIRQVADFFGKRYRGQY